MKRLLILSCFISITLTIQAQTPKLPEGKPGKVTLPTPKIQPLKPDLEVTTINFIRARKDSVREGSYYITVAVNIKNNGAPASSPCSLKGQYMRESTHGTYWDAAPQSVNIAAIPGGSTLSAQYVFAIPIRNLGAGSYNLGFRVQADGTATVAESNELNNESRTLQVRINL